MLSEPMSNQTDMPRRPTRGLSLASVFASGLVLLHSASSVAEDRFPPPEFRTGYQIPQDQFPMPAAGWWNWLDTGLLVLCLSLAAWFVFYRRSRRDVFALTVFAVAWFGFVRKGCVCPIGSIQNVTEAIATGGTLPWVVGAFFALPLIFVFLFGRVFCSGVCPLGAIQDLFAWKSVHVPRPVEVGLGLLAYLYLGLAVMYAALGGPYIICQYDPFVPLFRLNGPSYMLFSGGVLLLLGMFVGRPYCRFLCPYGVILRLLSRFSRKQVTITPAECINCRLCEKSCPFGAIRLPSVQSRPTPALAGKRALVTVLLLSPLIVAGLAGVGYASGNALSRLHRDVQLAEEVARDEAAPTQAPSDSLRIFKQSAQAPADLYDAIHGLQQRFRVGASLVGLWMGVVVSGKLIAHSVRRRRSDYTTDPGTCIGCARCFSSCPVELKRRGVISELPVVEVP
jgi:NosR/NirI family transcriptional regulator, nitrous oxide reductase regulator